MLAIAARSFNKPSETFIRDHARIIAPGKTVLICNDVEKIADLDHLILTSIPYRTLPDDLQSRFVNAARHRWRAHVRMTLSATDENRTVAFLREHQVRALLVEYLNTAVMFTGAARKAGVPLYAHAHGYDASVLIQKKHWVRRYRKLFRHAAGILAPSQFLADKLAEVGCPEVILHVNPCGIDPARFPPTKRLPLHLLAVGRFTEKKAPGHTINAFAKVRQFFPDAQLDFIGDGDLFESCLSLISELGLEGAVCLHGAQPSHVVQRMMGEASIFLQHSVTAPSGDTEGLPVSILEAMASALPVLSTRHSGIPEAVIDRTTGLLVDEHDVDGMAAAICALLADPARAKAMGEAGHRRALSKYTHAHSRERLRRVMCFPPANNNTNG